MKLIDLLIENDDVFGEVPVDSWPLDKQRQHWVQITREITLMMFRFSKRVEKLLDDLGIEQAEYLWGTGGELLLDIPPGYHIFNAKLINPQSTRDDDVMLPFVVKGGSVEHARQVEQRYNRLVSKLRPDWIHLRSANERVFDEQKKLIAAEVQWKSGTLTKTFNNRKQQTNR